MQDVFVQRPYRFVGPIRNRWCPAVIRDLSLFSRHLRRGEGVVGYECRHADRLRALIHRGDSILITPNHCRTADPLVMGWLARDARCIFYAMASWHLFNQGWFYRLAIRLMGGFSVYREGLDRQAIDLAIQMLIDGDRPLVIFPEGTASRTNDRLLPLLEGVTFIARTAARKRERRGSGRVVILPVAIKYRFEGDLDASVIPVLQDVERRLTWQPQDHLPLLPRLEKIGQALLSLKEMEYTGRVSRGPLFQRQQRLIDELLHPLEEEWLGSPQSGGVIARIKGLRMKLLPDMIKKELDDQETARRWRQISDTYLAQQVACYPENYLAGLPSIDRILETVERFEEDLTDRARVHGHLKAIIHVDEPIEVPARRERKSRTDPLLDRLESRLQELLDELSGESPLYTN